MKNLLWRLKHKTSKQDMEVRLEYEKKYMYHLIQGFDEGKMRDLLVWLLRRFDYTYSMNFDVFQNFIYEMHEAELKSEVDSRTYTRNE